VDEWREGWGRCKKYTDVKDTAVRSCENGRIVLTYRCPRRNVPDFGRVFLMLKHTDITQNTYVQS